MKLDSLCKRLGMMINSSKTQIVHFRSQSSTTIGLSFKCGEENLNVVSNYTYLSLIVTENLDYQITAKMLAQSAS